MADAMRLGADGLLTEDGLLRTAIAPPTQVMAIFRSVEDAAPPVQRDDNAPAPGTEEMLGEPVLTADELRALLQEPPARKGD
jgi:hypothetical protein